MKPNTQIQPKGANTWYYMDATSLTLLMSKTKQSVLICFVAGFLCFTQMKVGAPLYLDNLWPLIMGACCAVLGYMQSETLTLMDKARKEKLGET